MTVFYMLLVGNPTNYRAAEAFIILFSGEENNSTNFNEMVVLNALDFSFDLDVDPSADQALTFTWFCKKSDEVCLLCCLCLFGQQMRLQ